MAEAFSPPEIGGKEEPMKQIVALCIWTQGVVLASGSPAGAQPADRYEYLVLATSRTSTMEREMNEAAEDGYRFKAVMGGDREAGDTELVAIMVRDPSPGRRSYRVLATAQTSTMQAELEEAGAEGYDHRGQTVYPTIFGVQEVVVVLERDEEAPAVRYDYELLATNRTSTMQRELSTAGRRGFEVVGLTVSETEFGGFELVVITRRVGAR